MFMRYKIMMSNWLLIHEVITVSCKKCGKELKVIVYVDDNSDIYCKECWDARNKI